MTNNLKYDYMGYTIFESESCCDKVRVRRHRKKRTDKKWCNLYGYKYIPSQSIYVTADKMIFGHPNVIRKMISTLEEKQEGRYIAAKLIK